MEDGAKHTLVLYNCKVPMTGELVFTAANAKCSANLKVKGELPPPRSRDSTELAWFWCFGNETLKRFKTLSARCYRRLALWTFQVQMTKNDMDFLTGVDIYSF